MKLVAKHGMSRACNPTNRLSMMDDDAEDAGVPQGELALLETRIRTNTVDMFKRVLLFSQGAAEALYNDQMIR
jgi:hypothetical protein